MIAAAIRICRVVGCLAMALTLPLVAFAQTQDKPVKSVASADGTVRVDLLSLKRSEGDTVTLRLSLVNRGNTNFSIVLGNMRLIDLIGRRSYAPGLTSSNCTAPPDKQVACWAMFAAPPPNLKTMSVQFYEQLDLVSGVPVSE